MGLFLSVILPIMAVFASGIYFTAYQLLDVKSVSAVSLYIIHHEKTVSCFMDTVFLVRIVFLQQPYDLYP